MKYLVLLLLLSMPELLSAQVNDSIPKAPAGSGVPNVLNLRRQFFFIDFTQNNWLNTPDGVKTKFIGGGVNINFLYEFSIIKTSLGIAPGLSYSVTSVKTNSIYEYTYGGSSFNDIVYTDLVKYDSSNYKKSKLSTSFIDIPVEIHFHTRPNDKGRSFLIAPGFRGGVSVGDFWKLKFAEDVQGVNKAKIYGIANLSDFHYGISLRLVYYKFGVYGYYSLSKLFDDGKGPAVTPISFGITLSPL